MHYIFHDGKERETLKPLTWTRPVADLRLGILTLREKWLLRLPKSSFSYRSAPYLGGLFNLIQPQAEQQCHLRAAALASQELVDAVQALRPGQKLVDAQGEWLASLGDDATEKVVFKAKVPMVRRPFDLFRSTQKRLRPTLTSSLRGELRLP